MGLQLSEIVDVLFHHGPRRSPIILPRTVIRQQSREGKLLRHIRSGNATSAAATWRTRRRLLDTLLHLELPAANAKRSRYANDRDLFLSRTLWMLGAYSTAVYLAHRGYQRAQELEEPGNAVLFLEILRSQAQRSSDLSAVITISKQLNDEARKCTWYLRTGSFVDTARAIAAINTAPDREAANEITRMYDESLASAEARLGVKAREQLLLLRYYAAWVARDFKSALRIADELITVAQSSNRMSIDGPALLLLRASIPLRDYRSARRAVLLCNEHTPVDIADWFMFKEYESVLYVHLGQYARALKVIVHVSEQAAWAQLPHPDRERWRLLEWYAKYLAGDAATVSRQALRSLLKSYRSDKAGLRFAGRILEILLLLAERRHDDVIDRLEPLRTYSNRYLRDEADRTSRMLVEFLLDLERFSFEPTRCALQAKRTTEAILSLETSRPSLLGWQPAPYEAVIARIVKDLYPPA